MKKFMIGISVSALFLVMGTTVLAGSSAPKNLCYQWDSMVPITMMMMKSQGTIKTLDGPVKFYSVNGTHLFPTVYPPATITGTATFTNGILRFSHTSILRSDGNPGSDSASYYLCTNEGSVDTATGTGALTSTRILIPDAGGTVTVPYVDNITITVVPCKNYSITSSAAIPTSASEMKKDSLIAR